MDPVDASSGQFEAPSDSDVSWDDPVPTDVGEGKGVPEVTSPGASMFSPVTAGGSLQSKEAATVGAGAHVGDEKDVWAHSPLRREAWPEPMPTQHPARRYSWKEVDTSLPNVDEHDKDQRRVRFFSPIQSKGVPRDGK